MRILMTVNAAWNIWHFRRPVVEALLADGHEVVVLAPPDDSVTSLQRLGCRVLPLEMNVKGLNPVQDFRLMLRFYRHFRQIRPDIVLSYTIKNNLFGAMAAKLCKLPFVPNVTGLGTAFLSGGLLRRVAETLYRRAFAGLPLVFFQNDDDRQLFITHHLIGRGQARLLPGSGIDLSWFAAEPYPPAGPEAAPVFLMIARLLRDKGVVEFSEAARRIKADLPQARFQLLGAQDVQNRSAIDADTLQSWIAEGRIEYLGTTKDVRPLIAQAHCVVLPSYREGAPRTLIEAAAMARPVIATDVPGCRAVMQDRVSGFFCAPRDAESLAAAMRRFLGLSGQAQAALGLAGRRKMEADFDQAIVVQAYRGAIADLTAPR